jgi:hypothetical protein
VIFTRGSRGKFEKRVGGSASAFPIVLGDCYLDCVLNGALCIRFMLKFVLCTNLKIFPHCMKFYPSSDV